jgi:DNA processing protein
MALVDRSAPGSACEPCLRRSWLLARLSATLDYRCADIPRLTELLALEDEELIAALGGSRTAALEAEYARFEPAEPSPGTDVETLCRHDAAYPLALRDPGAPRMLNVRGGGRRLSELTATAAVAVVGTRRASDYGVAMAKSLGRGLSASGVTVVSALSDGIAAAAHDGTLEAAGQSVAVLAGGLDVGCPARLRTLLDRLAGRGCAVSELPGGCQGRRWGPVAAERTIARLADVTVVVEAGEEPRELAGALIARATGGTVAALPGRVTSPGARGTNALLMDGAHLVRGVKDTLDLLPARAARASCEGVRELAELEPRLLELLERVGDGIDTPEKLIGAASDAGAVLLALTELELMSLLGRGEGGRYVPREPLP